MDRIVAVDLDMSGTGVMVPLRVPLDFGWTRIQLPCRQLMSPITICGVTVFSQSPSLI